MAVATADAARAPGTRLGIGPAAALWSTALVAVSLLGASDELATGLPALTVASTGGQSLRLVALLIAVLLTAAVWSAQSAHPSAAVGLGVAAVGFLIPAWAAWQWLPSPVRALALAAAPLVVAGLAQVGLRWPVPAGRRSLAMTRTVYVVAGAASVVHAAGYDAFQDPGCRLTCEKTATPLHALISTTWALELSALGTVAAAAIGVLALLAQRMRLGDPVRIAVLVSLFALAISAGLRWATVRDIAVGNATESLLDGLDLGAVALVSVAVCLAAVRSRRVRRRLVRLAADMVQQPGRDRGLHDVHFAIPGESRWVDREGCDVDTPPAGRVDLVLGADGEPMLRLVAGRLSTGDGPPTLTPAMLLGLDNARLAAVTLARQREVRASQLRLVTAADAERRRIQRDLHDGTQQRLVSAALHLRISLTRAAEPRADRLQGAETDVREALVALRELTHTMSPRVLVEEGLTAALEDLTVASAVPTELDARLDAEPPAEVAAAVYAAAAA